MWVFHMQAFLQKNLKGSLILKNKANFCSELKSILSNFNEGETLCVHCCCAPCSSTVISFLASKFRICLYFYNPNIDTIDEYEKRLSELKIFVSKINSGLYNIKPLFNIEVFDEGYNSSDFYKSVIGMEKEPEGGKRCETCYLLRLNATKEFAKKKNIKYILTSLTLSPMKNAEKINKIGCELSDKDCQYLVSDFKKENGYIKSIDFSKEFDLYRQDYCGCIYSKVNKKDFQHN